MSTISQSEGAVPLSKVDLQSDVTQYTKTINTLRTSYLSGKTRPVSYRIEQLRGLLAFLEENTQALIDAVKEDLRKNDFESDLFEVEFVKQDIKGALMDIKDWVKPEKAGKTLMSVMDQPLIQPEPFGVALVIGAWNYPVHLLLSPVVGAIAAGNAVVMKPSEVSPNTAKVMDLIVPKYMDAECFAVIQGGAQETTELLKERFDYIFYTGSIGVGKVIHAAATKYLTPCTLELGGKSPTIIDESVDLVLACRRIVWGKLVNAGQTCIAPDYVLCPNSIYDRFVETCRNVVTEFYGEDVSASKDFGRIVNVRHVKRVARMLNGAKIAFGGEVNENDRYIAPTILTDVKDSDPVMQEEIFGPIMPVVRLMDPDPVGEAIRFINNREKPLTLYVFSTNQSTIKRVLDETSSGSVCVNDTLVHLSVDSLPFGGVGMSGMGSYHGRHTFDTFSHKKAVLIRDFNPIGEAIGRKRYPPIERANVTFFRQILARRSNPLSGIIKVLPYAACFALGIGASFLLRYAFQHGDKMERIDN